MLPLYSDHANITSTDGRMSDLAQQSTSKKDDNIEGCCDNDEASEYFSAHSQCCSPHSPNIDSASCFASQKDEHLRQRDKIGRGLKSLARQIKRHNDLKARLSPIAAATVLFREDFASLPATSKATVVLQLTDYAVAQVFLHCGDDIRRAMVVNWILGEECCG